MKSLTIRRAAAEDDAGIVAIYNLHEPDMVPLTLEYVDARVEHGSDRYVAILDHHVVGYGSFQWAWWTKDPGIYAMELRVDPVRARQGIGTELFDSMRAPLLERGAKHLSGWIRADSAAGHRWATRSGFTATELVIQEYHLAIADADTSAVAEYEARLNAAGVRIVSLAELDRTDAAFLHALKRLWSERSEDNPDPIQFEAWQEQVLHAPGLNPATHWIAMEDEHPVGTTLLRQTREKAYENDYTAVSPTHRGRGIATALKLHAIRWAQQSRAEWFYTSSEIDNTPMISIHTRLGYRPSTLRHEVARALP